MSKRKPNKRRGIVKQSESSPPEKRDERFRQLLDMARGGDECAPAELFQRYGFMFGRDEE